MTNIRLVIHRGVDSDEPGSEVTKQTSTGKAVLKLLAEATADTPINRQIRVTKKGPEPSIVVHYSGGARRGRIVTFTPIETYKKKGWRQLIRIANAINEII